ncbi:MAG: flagellar motor protein MotB [Bacteroidetes bacterium]|nr:flagellar motor protein MotB [Bacteroidota bacterium]MBP7398002.1 flagellar motor protein MotB [Chitinophagales bacterium]MBK7108559.1 flagellar motor protein MotB [Bacteroidota bacterium]MBK8489117.1 flagellar motor protein MotB [Bacteroidota bacterium]MBK8680966.1 flagellar motor protein MotB [Bacteroidota bacterium]
MKRHILIISGCCIILTSCVSQKKYGGLETQYRDTQTLLIAANDQLSSTTADLNACLSEKSQLSSNINLLNDQIVYLKSSNQDLIIQIGNMTTLTTKGAENLEKSLESMREKDLTIMRLQDAVNRKDSVTLALVTSLKGVLGNMNDEDIVINVEKGVVFISISDKLLFESGSYKVTDKAKEVLGKVATVVNNKPEFEFMVEGHTDDVPISKPGIQDNWDLSVLRATAVVRILQEQYNVNPARMTAAGRSYYVPVAENDTPENKSLNRRTRIVILPKLDQFYSMIEEGLDEMSTKTDE